MHEDNPQRSANPVTEFHPADPVATSVLDHDLSCTRCGYNLRGLRTDGVCPECATPISRSGHGNLLRYADPDWVNKLRLGSSHLRSSLLLSFVLPLGLIIALGPSLPRVFGGLIDVVVGLLVMSGAILLTTPEPTVAHREDPMTLRRLVRGCAVFLWIGIALRTPAGVGLGPTVAIVADSMLLIGVVSYFGTLVFLRRFALRVPDAKIARHTRIVMWGFGISLVVSVVGGRIATITAGVSTSPIATGGSVPAWAHWLGAGVLSVANVVFLVFGLWNVMLLFSYPRLFKKAAIESRTTLAAAVARSGNQPNDARPQN